MLFIIGTSFAIPLFCHDFSRKKSAIYDDFLFQNGLEIIFLCRLCFLSIFCMTNDWENKKRNMGLFLHLEEIKESLTTQFWMQGDTGLCQECMPLGILSIQRNQSLQKKKLKTNLKKKKRQKPSIPRKKYRRQLHHSLWCTDIVLTLPIFFKLQWESLSYCVIRNFYKLDSDAITQTR